jgi:hypothetical protein
VSLGDLLDRGPESRKALDLLMRLEGEAAAAGGAVHVLLGNHEVMNIAGDLRYVSPPEYAAFAGPEDDSLREAAWQAVVAKDPAAVRAEFDTAFPPGYFGHAKAFTADGTYGRWLFEKPYLIVINDTAFVHAGLPPMVASLGLEATNETLRGQLRDYLSTWQTIAKELNLARSIGFQERPESLAAMAAQPQSEAIAKLQDGELFTAHWPDLVSRPGALLSRHRDPEPRQRAHEARRQARDRGTYRFTDRPRPQPLRWPRATARHGHAGVGLPGRGVGARLREGAVERRLRRPAGASGPSQSSCPAPSDPARKASTTTHLSVSCWKPRSSASTSWTQALPSHSA